MLSANQSRYLVTIGFAMLHYSLLATFAETAQGTRLLAIDCISALYFTATLFIGLKERKKGAVAASAVCLIIAIASFFI